MRKYVLMFSSLSYMGISVWQLYSAYAPRVGPIGNGPNETIIWLNFLISMVGGMAFLVLSIKMFLKK